jgi:very-short-patch-repair endonuclease
MNNFHSRKYLKAYRKDLRNNMTWSEMRLWSCLRNRKLKGKKFRRQHSIGNYIVDFFCFEEHLAIEVDGTSHDNPSVERYDVERDLYLNKQGIKVIRINAMDVKDNLEGVLQEIEEVLG